MEPDLVMEVPDTPDRLAQLANKSSGSSFQNENINVEVDPLSPSQGIKHLLQRRNSKHLNLKDTGERYDSTRSTTLADKILSTPGKSMSETVNRKPLLGTSFEVGKSAVSMDNKERVKRTDLNHDTLTLLNGAICEDAKRKRGKGLLSENSGVLRSYGSSALLGMGSSLPSMSVGHGRSQIGMVISDKDNLSLQNACADMKFRDKGKGVDSCSGVHSKSHQDLASVIQTVVPQRPRGLRRLVRNGCISPYNIARVSNESEVNCQNGKTSGGQKCSSFARISDQDKLQGIDILDDLQPKVSQRKLVRNVCISHNSSGSSKQPIEDELMEIEFGRVPKPNRTSNQIHNVNPDSRGRSDDVKKGKGKAKTDIYTMTNGQHGKANFPLSRLDSRKDVAIYGDSNTDVLGFEDQGWKTDGWREKESTVSSFKTANICESEASGHQSDQSNVVAIGTERPSSESDLESRRKKHTDRKRKYGSSSNFNGESSSSVLDWRFSKSRSTKTHNPHERGIILGSVIEVDELHSPEARSSNLQEQSHSIFDSCNAMTRRVESDELFAQQLQEQLYNESPGIRNREEIDASIAWSLQQEENARPMSLPSWQTQRNRRDRLITRLHSQQLPGNYLPQSVNTAQYGLSMRSAPWMRYVDFPEMDVNMRSDLLDELDAGMNSISYTTNILHIQRDFDENDYETLLALDENNHQHSGASENQINNLPQSTVQADTIEECAVCLEKPSIGDIIRHLPCLHKFHKDICYKLQPWFLIVCYMDPIELC
ncbi:uncharacterized protein LOC103974609 isoform X1 [Musa acuminata AAA Group]|uniref:uncharacterized protein LOC103974609 isoform X1 n=1 Tax=Musa acuminata AAA Group TaxID=214697 RepID=UPI0031D069BC